MSHASAFRFFNTKAGGHFFTTDVAERDTVMASLPEYRPEGVGFQTMDHGAPGAVPVYRFFNTVAQGHFFTTDVAERDSVIANLPSFRFEGMGFEAASAPGADMQAVFRFYNTQAGGHFFTTDVGERDSVIANIPTFRYEGIGFYEPIGAAPAPAPVPAPTPAPVAASSAGVIQQGFLFNGTNGNDTIVGTAADETIGGSRGNDVLTGGGGNDTFVFIRNDGRDKITDYNQGDRMLFSGTSDMHAFIVAAHGPPAAPGQMSGFGGYDVVYKDQEISGFIHLDGITNADLPWVQASMGYILG